MRSLKLKSQWAWITALYSTISVFLIKKEYISHCYCCCRHKSRFFFCFLYVLTIAAITTKFSFNHALHQTRKFNYAKMKSINYDAISIFFSCTDHTLHIAISSCSLLERELMRLLEICMFNVQCAFLKAIN